MAEVVILLVGARHTHLQLQLCSVGRTGEGARQREQGRAHDESVQVKAHNRVWTLKPTDWLLRLAAAGERNCAD